LLSKNIKIKIYITLILPVVLYGCDAWSVILRVEHRLMVFEYRMLRKIFGSKKDEVTRELGRLHNEELYDLYSSPNIMRVIKSRRMRLAGHLARMGRPLGRPRRRWEEDIKIDLQETWVGLIWLRIGTGGGLL
jgi:hypothetical protein